MYKLPPAERGRNILHERHKRETYDIHRKKVRASFLCPLRPAQPPPAPSTAAAHISEALPAPTGACGERRINMQQDPRP